MYNTVLSHDITDRLTYVVQFDTGTQGGGNLVTGEDVDWYGVNQYLFYEINPCWKAGVRYEWFSDDDGTRVAEMAGHWHQLTLGLNYTPNANVRFRPELRWDWFDHPSPGTTPTPYANGTSASQFLAAMDMIITY